MKRLLEQADPSFGALGALLPSAERYEGNPFAKRSMQSRLSRALAAGGGRRPILRPALLGVAGLLLAATAAAASYSMWAPAAKTAAPSLPVPPSESTGASHVAPPPAPVAEPEREPEPEPEPTTTDATSVPAPSVKRLVEKPRPGEDPSQVAEAVRALRKQGDSARAQALLDQYLKNNPRGALAEDALALSIEAAAARKDPRAADYARRYLARYPNGRFRSVAERALSR
jgi:protein TonB